MAATYNLEPPPTAKVLLQTTAGDIELELFAKQTPLTSRNFLQLCLDGYYDNTIFHRLVPGFVIQGGDPTGTGAGGEAIYPGGTFQDEFHSRLRFNRRGLLGMANTGQKDDNGSQFFITLGKTEELNGKNTMFGRVVGDTIYNVMRMGEAELTDDGGERPLYPTRVTGAEILVNPFEDMVKRELQRAASKPEEREKKRPKKKAGKQLLSFGAPDDGDEEEIAPSLVKKPKFNPKLVAAAPGVELATNGQTLAASKPQREQSRSHPAPPVSKQDSEPMRSSGTKISAPKPRATSPTPSPTPSPSPEPQISKSQALEVEIANLKASMRRTTGNSTKIPERKKSALESLIPATSTRGRKRKAPGSAPQEDRATLDMLAAFKAKLEHADEQTNDKGTDTSKDPVRDDTLEKNPSSANPDLPDEEEQLCDLHFIANCQSCRNWDIDAANLDDTAGMEAGDEGDTWMSHSLRFEKDRLGKDLKFRKQAEEELVVIDPREKEKELKGGRRDKDKGAYRRDHDHRSDGTEWSRRREKGEGAREERRDDRRRDRDRR